MAKIIGSSPLPQAKVNEKIWEYIKRHGLQDEDNKQMINTDEHLKAIFDGRNQVSLSDILIGVKHLSVDG